MYLSSAILKQILPGYGTLEEIKKVIVAETGKGLVEAGFGLYQRIKDSLYTSIEIPYESVLFDPCILYLQEMKALAPSNKFEIKTPDHKYVGGDDNDNDNIRDSKDHRRRKGFNPACLIPQYRKKRIKLNGKVAYLTTAEKEVETITGTNFVKARKMTIRIDFLDGTENDILWLIKTLEQRIPNPSDNNQIELWVNAGSYWDELPPKDDRSLDSIFLDFKEDVINDIEAFLSKKAEYLRLGIPYRRGYLFEGTPGTGKTSMIHAISTRFRLPIYYVSLNTKIEATFLSSLNNVPERCLLVLEDIDCLGLPKRGEKNDGLTLSMILNSIDGLLAGSGRIVIMTTNKSKELDPALKREGRVDRTFTFGYCSAVQKEKMSIHFLGEKAGKAFANKVKKKEMTQATLQEMLLKERKKNETLGF